MQYRTRTGVLALLFGAAACSKDSSTAPSSADALLNADVATIAADATAQDVEVMQGPGGAFAMGLHFDPARFDCMREFPERLTVDRTCVFKDADGNVQAAYDPATTASATISTTIDGSIDRDYLQATLHRESQYEVTGLEGAETTRTWNGSGSGTRSAVREKSDGGTRSYEASTASTVTDVVIPVPRSSSSWPLSGTIHRTITITRSNGKTVTRDVTITFNGTEFITILVNGESYDFDLQLRRRPHRHNGG